MSDPDFSPVDSHRRARVKAVLERAGFGDVLVLSHEQADRALKPIYQELIEAIASEDVESISELAAVVGRDRGNVKRNLDLLAERDIIGFRENGQARQPYLKYDTIIREPVTTKSITGRQEPQSSK